MVDAKRTPPRWAHSRCPVGGFPCHGLNVRIASKFMRWSSDPHSDAIWEGIRVSGAHQGGIPGWDWRP